METCNVALLVHLKPWNRIQAMFPSCKEETCTWTVLHRQMSCIMVASLVSDTFKSSTSSSSRWRTPTTSSISRQQEASRPASNVAETLVFEWQLIANIISANKQGKEAKRWWRFNISGCLAGIRNVGSEEKFSTDQILWLHQIWTHEREEERTETTDKREKRGG